MNVTPAMGIVQIDRISQKPIVKTNEFGLTTMPNPNSGNMKITFSLLEEGETDINIFDINGKKVNHVLNQNMPKGQYIYTINTTLNNGYYYIILTHNDKFTTNKILINK
jgi:hypothetical protein